MEDQVNLFGIIGLKQVSIEVLTAKVEELQGERDTLAARLEAALEDAVKAREELTVARELLDVKTKKAAK